MVARLHGQLVHKLQHLFETVPAHLPFSFILIMLKDRTPKQLANTPTET